MIPVGTLNHFVPLFRPLGEKEPGRLRGKLTQNWVLYSRRGVRGQGTGEFVERSMGLSGSVWLGGTERQGRGDWRS